MKILIDTPDVFDFQLDALKEIFPQCSIRTTDDSKATNYLIDKVCLFFSLTEFEKSQMMEGRRFRRLVQAKYCICFIECVYNRKGEMHVANIFGMNHSSINNAKKSIRDWISTDKKFNEQFCNLLTFLDLDINVIKL